MYVKELDITNFRNYEKQTVALSSGLNVFYGNNAQGKTNLMEAVSICSVGRSPRTPRDKELIRWGSDKAKIKLTVVARGGNEKVEIVIDKTENKRIAINSLPISRMGELMGVVSSVFFSPNEIKIVGASPSERRSFMDIALCQMSRAYFYLLSRYNKILSQRNKLLKSGKVNNDILDVWDAQLAESGSKIIKTRLGFVKRLSTFAEKNHSYLTDNKEELVLTYDGIDGETTDEISVKFIELLKSQRERDIYLGHTHSGPQKDDIIIRASGIDLRSYGSQGQLRTAALSLKLAELDLNFVETGDCPVLLLDDVLSELDNDRQNKLFARIKDMQVILTCTDLDNEVFKTYKDFKRFKVENGKIIL